MKPLPHPPLRLGAYPRKGARMRLLVVEDRPRQSAMLVMALSDAGHSVETAADGDAALDLAVGSTYDAIVLDMTMPEIDGLAMVAKIREAGHATPVLILTARDDVDHRVDALDRGADDYLVKPFAFEELLARLRALARRRFAVSPTALVAVGDLEIDTAAKSVRRAGERVRLTAREYSVLECLALRKGRVVSRDTLTELLYERGQHPESNVVEVYVGYLRKKLGMTGGRQLIHTRRGLGYVLDDGG